MLYLLMNIEINKCLHSSFVYLNLMNVKLGLMINAVMLFASSRRLIFGGLVIALGLTGKSLSSVNWELMKPTRRPSVS